MAIKVGNSWVSEISYARAKANIGSKGSENLKKVTVESLSKKYSGTNFSANTEPFMGNGLNNIAISPNILAQMGASPEKRVEYEALIMDCIDIQKSMPSHSYTGSKMKAQGFIINNDGSLSSWCITEPKDTSNNKKHITELHKDRKDSWLDKILSDMDTNKNFNIKI